MRREALANAKYAFVPATSELLTAVAEAMRLEDAAEVWALAHLTPGEALESSASCSKDATVALYDGRPISAFGTGEPTVLSDCGAPWMLSVEGVEKHARMVAVASRLYFEDAKKRYSRLENFVDARNTATVRWLAWLGFAVDEPRALGPDNLPFHRFSWSA